MPFILEFHNDDDEIIHSEVLESDRLEEVVPQINAYHNDEEGMVYVFREQAGDRDFVLAKSVGFVIGRDD